MAQIDTKNLSNTKPSPSKQMMHTLTIWGEGKQNKSDGHKPQEMVESAYELEPSKTMPKDKPCLYFSACKCYKHRKMD